MERFRALAFISNAMAFVAVTFAQTPPPATTRPGSTLIVRGRVVADDTGDPLPNARVSSSDSGQLGAPVIRTDRAGQFAVTGIVGRSLVVSKSTYASKTFTVMAAPAPLEIRLQHGAVIAGRVIDELGEPIVGARVTAEIPSNGQTWKTVATCQTNDQGAYRLGSLSPATFAVGANTIETPYNVRCAATRSSRGRRSTRRTIPVPRHVRLSICRWPPAIFGPAWILWCPGAFPGGSHLALSLASELARSHRQTRQRGPTARLLGELLSAVAPCFRMRKWS
jgi:protocatechuate 3,4-dioxygenase beta subunit